MIKSNILVMVVDDEPLMCDILQRILTEAGDNVITVNDGEAALKLVKEKKPDVIMFRSHDARDRWQGGMPENS